MRIYSIALSLFFALPAASLADDFPTEETVRIVLNCMAELGAQTDDNLYTCVCRHDVITKLMTFDEYDGAKTFERNKEMPGDRGATLRDMKLGKDEAKKLQETRAAADTQCPVVRHIEAKKDNK